MVLSRSRALTAIAAALAVPRLARADTPTLHLGAVPTDSYAEPYYGLDGGYFTKADLDVQITGFASGGQITAAVAGHALDAGLADPIQVGAGFEHGVPFGYFAGGDEYSTDAPSTQLCVAKNGSVKSPADLAGKTLGVFGLRSMPQFATLEWLANNGVDASHVNFVEIPPAAMVPAIARGTVAAGLVPEPHLSEAPISGVVAFAKVYDAVAPHFYINSWFASRDWIASNREVAHRFAQALYSTARWANEHPAETLPILAKYSKMKTTQIAKMTRSVYDTKLDPAKLQPPLTIAAKYKVLPKPLTAAQLIIDL